MALHSIDISFTALHYKTSGLQEPPLGSQEERTDIKEENGPKSCSPLSMKVKESAHPTRIIVDTDIFKHLLLCEHCNGKRVDVQVQQTGNGPSPTMKVSCQDCGHIHSVQTSPKMKFSEHRTRTNAISIYMMCAIIFCGLTYAKVCTYNVVMNLFQMKKLFQLLGLHIPSHTFYKTSVIPKLEVAVQEEMDLFLLTCRQKSNIHDTGIVVDAGWSHPGWWARECTVIALDDKTNLPIHRVHIRKGFNYSGSSKGVTFSICC